MSLDVEKLTKQLMRHEGSKKKGNKHIPYKDSLGIWTAGYGHNLEAGGISERAALLILEDDIREHMAELYVKLPWIHNLDGVRQAILVNMAFNMGVKGLLTFKNTLTLIEHGDYKSAAASMLKSKWAEQVKGRAVELAKMMETGEWHETT